MYWNGSKYKLDFTEQKTGKKREFTVPLEIYNFIKMYCLENNIKPSARIFTISERAVQMHLKYTCEYLGYERVSTHSFRKKFATDIYNKNGHNVVLVKELLQHSTIAVTQKYLGLEDTQIENAILGSVNLV